MNTISQRPYQICTKTIMDTTDPTIVFNEKGESDYYTNFKENIEPNWHTDDRGYEELMKIADKIKKTSKNKDFDCIIGLSGGLDSSYAAYIAKEVMGRIFRRFGILYHTRFFGKPHHTGYAFDSPMDRYGNLNLHIFHLGRFMRVLTQTYSRSKRFRENIAGTRGYSRSLRQRIDSLARYIHISDFRFITPMLASTSFLH